ncbi:hydrolase [Ornithinibacillus salinisoli]|uniref:Hydrolase n=1 Tax=Ornithinibacillus salinisoli TaxID=1848459 RepID=A0ABW4VXC7_9BACI
MGSRIMHLIIANEIADRLSIGNKQAFLIGGIAPDAVSPKDLSHFFEGDHEEFTRKIAYEKFYQKYPSKDEYILGYYTHLIADDMWLKGFFIPWLKNRMENEESIFEKYHGDFRLLNSKLLHHYQLDVQLLDGMEHIDLIDLEEVKASDVKEFVPYVKEDMNYSMEDLEAKLQVFTFEQIRGYVETSVEKSLLKLKEIMK